MEPQGVPKSLQHRCKNRCLKKFEMFWKRTSRPHRLWGVLTGQETVLELLNQRTSQPASQATNQSASQPTSEQTNQPTNQQNNLPTHQLTDRPISYVKASLAFERIHVVASHPIARQGCIKELFRNRPASQIHPETLLGTILVDLGWIWAR